MTATTTLPTSVGQMTSAWLTKALRASKFIASDVTVTSVRAERIAEGVGFLSLLYRLRLDFDGAAPTTLVAKLPATSEYRHLAKMSGAYDREVAFYSNIAPVSPLRTPRAHVAVLDPGGSDFVLVLDDLGSFECADHLAGLSFDRTVRVIDELAIFHAWGWNLSPDVSRHPAFPSITEPTMANGYAMAAAFGWAVYGQHGRTPVPEAVAKVVEGFATSLPSLLGMLSEPTTLINGDLRPDNLFFDPQGCPVTVDFQVTMQGAGIWDVAYLVGQGMTPVERGGRERELVQRYVDGLAAAGIDYSFEMAWQQLRVATVIQIVYPLGAMLSWETLSDRAQDLLHALMERALSIIADVDGLSALPG